MTDFWDELIRTSFSETTIKTATTPVIVAPISDGRVAIVISNNGANPVFLSLFPGASGTQGIVLGGTGSAFPNTINLSLLTHGRMVRGPIYAYSPGGASQVTVWESLHPCGCQRKGMPNVTY